jgi:hypothetical protein
MKKSIYSLLLVAVFASGCDGCADEIVKITVAIGNTHIVKKRISGIQFLEFDKGDSKDGFSAQNGFLCVTHNPGCGISGNNGTDKFFGSNKPLPPNCVVEGVLFTQFWPAGINAEGDTYNGLFGWGTYGTRLSGGGVSPNEVSWKNACQGSFGSKNLCYSISFIISMPDGLDLGEPVFDIADQSPNLCQPPGYLNFPPSGPTAMNNCTVSTTTDFVLPCKWNRAVGTATYVGTLTAPSNGCGGQLNSITNHNLFAINLVNNGKSLLLGIGATTTPEQLSELYGAANPALPVIVNVQRLDAFDPTLVATISVSMNFTIKQ